MRTDEVYFLQQVSGGPIKIGASYDVRQRLYQITLWAPHPLVLLATVPNGDLERNIQDCFADYHYHHEWFHPGPRLIGAIAAINDGVPVEQAIDLSDRRGNTLRMTQLATRERNARVAA